MPGDLTQLRRSCRRRTGALNAKLLYVALGRAEHPNQASLIGFSTILLPAERQNSLVSSRVSNGRTTLTAIHATRAAVATLTD